MSKVVVYMSMSLDGFIAAADDGPGRGLGIGGEVLHRWLTEGNIDPTSFRPAGAVNGAVFDEMLTSGAVITGRHTFEWAGDWGGDHHDGVPIFVLTRSQPQVRGRATYLADLHDAVSRAKAAAGDRHVMVHGASSVQALVGAGLVDQLVLHVVPVLLGRGKRLFADTGADEVPLGLASSVEGEGGVLHLRYDVLGTA
jgi:dihydrofolate reductase